jgi:hypothetical protein
MARGHIGGSRRLQFDPTAFLQGDGKDEGDTAMAMQLMGYGRGASPEELGLSREKLLADIAGQTGTQDIQRQQLEETRRSNLSAEDFQKFQKEQLLKNAADELKYKQDVLGQEGRKNEMAMVSDYIKNHPELSPQQVEGMIGGFSPTMKQFFTGAADQAQAAKASALLPSIQAAYKTGHPEEALKAMFADPNMAAILKRPEIPWQQLNESLGAQQSKSLTGGAGLARLLWNLPGAAENVTSALVNKAMSVLAGKHAPQLPMYEMTNPFEQAQGGAPGQTNIGKYWTTVDPLSGGPITMGPAPQAPAGGYNYGGTVAQNEAPPAWQYGTGTQPIPTGGLPELPVEELLSRVTEPPRMPTVGGGYLTPEAVMPTVGGVIPEAQLGEYAPGAGFSRQGLPDLRYTAPHEPNAIDRLLATLGLR